jgi:hypothetical protein
VTLTPLRNSWHLTYLAVTATPSTDTGQRLEPDSLGAMRFRNHPADPSRLLGVGEAPMVVPGLNKAI